MGTVLSKQSNFLDLEKVIKYLSKEMEA